MNTLVFDTETTGMIVKGADCRHPGQPGVVQVGAILYVGRKVEAELNVIVRPEDDCGEPIPIDPGAFAKHGIDAEKAERLGVPDYMAAALLGELAEKADRVVAYNVAFDLMIVEILDHRLATRKGGFGMVNPILLRPSACAMVAATGILKLPGRVAGRIGDYAYPNLTTAYQRLVDPAGFGGAHTAMADVKAAAAVLWAMEDRPETRTDVHLRKLLRMEAGE